METKRQGACSRVHVQFVLHLLPHRIDSSQDAPGQSQGRLELRAQGQHLGQSQGVADQVWLSPFPVCPWDAALSPGPVLREGRAPSPKTLPREGSYGQTLTLPPETHQEVSGIKSPMEVL